MDAVTASVTVKLLPTATLPPSAVLEIVISSGATADVLLANARKPTAMSSAAITAAGIARRVKARASVLVT